MLLVYASRTNNVQNIVDKLRFDNKLLLNIFQNQSIVLKEDFCLLTYTDLLGEIPQEVNDFLKKNSSKLKAVAGSGNRNFGENFCGAAKKISQIYQVPIVALFELSGDDESIDEFRKFLVNG